MVCSPLSASYAFGVCSRRRVALSSDDGKTFSGIPAAVQQIANLLGIQWDDKKNTNGCTPEDGHVMSRNGEPTQHPTFSKCSKESWEIRTQSSIGQLSCYKLNLSRWSPLRGTELHIHFLTAWSHARILHKE
ncbi:hypothetical protein ISCGN_012879 [Ixodes scapularis]